MVIDTKTKPSAVTKPTRWLQCTLALLVLLLLGCAVGLVLSLNPAAQQRRAVGFVVGLGGSIVYADEEDASWHRAPEWLRQMFGADYFKSVQVAYLHGSQVDNGALAELEAMTELEWLVLNDTQVGDAGLAHLTGLTTLQGLYLDDTRISDAGLAHLNELKELRVLSLSGTQVSDVGVCHLTDLSRLQRLWLDHTQVSDVGLAELHKALPDCEIIR